MCVIDRRDDPANPALPSRWFIQELGVRTSTLSMSLPVAMGYVPLGMVFGFLFVQAGGAWYLALAASLLVYAGASQFAMIPMLAAGLPVASLALAALVINLRHAFYGLSLLNDQPSSRLARLYLIFALTITTSPAVQGGDKRSIRSVLFLNIALEYFNRSPACAAREVARAPERVF